MSKKCPDCGSLNVEEVLDRVAYCKNCHLHCSVFELEDATVFDKIKQSPEAPAEKLVYEDFGGWWSVLFDYDCNWDSRDEAIAATVAKLKEVYDGQV